MTTMILLVIWTVMLVLVTLTGVRVVRECKDFKLLLKTMSEPDPFFVWMRMLSIAGDIVLVFVVVVALLLFTLVSGR